MPGALDCIDVCQHSAAARFVDDRNTPARCGHGYCAAARQTYRSAHGEERVVCRRADQNRPGIYDRTDHDGRTVVRPSVSSNNRQRALRLPVERNCIICGHAHYTAAGRRQRAALDCRAVHELDGRRSSTDLDISTGII